MFLFCRKWIRWQETLVMFIVLMVSGALAEGGEAKFEGLDCARIAKLAPVLAGRLKQAAVNSKNWTNGCRVSIGEHSFDGDLRRRGFGNTNIITISDRSVVTELVKRLGRDLRVASIKSRTFTSINEKQFKTPSFSLECDGVPPRCILMVVPD